jgi:TetR/AcrR family transcriptional regulator, cholesterol catabolism regulator
MKDNIKLKARGLFMQYGVRSISMDDIASEAGCSKKTLYQHYEDKEALMAEVMNDVLDDNIGACEKDKCESSNAIHEAFLAIESFAMFHGKVNPVVLFELHKYYPKVYQLFADYKEKYVFASIKNNIERGISEGLYRNDFNIEVMSQFRVQSIFIPFHPDFFSRVNKTLFEVMKEIFIHFVYGIASPEGYKLITKYKTELK